MQKVLIMSTMGNGLRSKAVGWTAEDGDEAAQAMEHLGPNPSLGLMGYYGKTSGKRYSYSTPYHALGDGWKLLSPPSKESTQEEDTVYEWWFVKD